MTIRARYLPFIVFNIFFFSAVANSQSLSLTLEHAREVRLLETDRSAVRQLFHYFLLDDFDDFTDEFIADTLRVEVLYSTGACDEDEEQVWQGRQGTVVRVEVSADDLKIDRLPFDLASLKKEQVYHDDDGRFIYHDKKRGIAIETDGEDVEKIILFPPLSMKSAACKSDFAREFISMESWFGTRKLKDRANRGCINVPASVTEVNLSQDVMSALSVKRVDVETTALDPDNDPLVYNYTVSAGRIVGSGQKVTWDLTGAPPGLHRITAGVDDGCGICGQTVTKTITLK